MFDRTYVERAATKPVSSFPNDTDELTPNRNFSLDDRTPEFRPQVPWRPISTIGNDTQMSFLCFLKAL